MNVRIQKLREKADKSKSPDDVLRLAIAYLCNDQAPEAIEILSKPHEFLPEDRWGLAHLIIGEIYLRGRPISVIDRENAFFHHFTAASEGIPLALERMLEMLQELKLSPLAGRLQRQAEPDS